MLGSKIEISYDDLAKMEYVGCVFKEALRKWPPGAQFSRVTNKAITLNGIWIPKNTWIEVILNFLNFKLKLIEKKHIK